MYNPINRYQSNFAKGFKPNLMIRFLKSLSFALLAVISFFPARVEATHIVGGQLNYRCLGNNRYEVTLRIFRDCDNANPAAVFDDPASIGIFDSKGNLLTFLGIGGQLLIKPMGDDTIPANVPICDPSIPLVCVHTTVYRDTILLPIR